MKDLFSSAMSFGNNLLNNLFAGQRQDDAQEFSAQQFATRYQTTTKDMQAAGLNPMLAYSQGGGNAPTSSAAGAAGGGDPGAVYTASRLASAQVANIEADTANKEKQGKLIEAQAAQAMGSAWQSNAQTELLDQQAREVRQKLENRYWDKEVSRIEAETGRLTYEQKRIVEAAEALRQQGILSNQQAQTSVWQMAQYEELVKKLRNETHLLHLDIKAAESLENLGRTSKELQGLIPFIRLLMRK